MQSGPSRVRPGSARSIHLLVRSECGGNLEGGVTVSTACMLWSGECRGVMWEELGRENEEGQLLRYRGAINRNCRATSINRATLSCHSLLLPTGNQWGSLHDKMLTYKLLYGLSIWGEHKNYDEALNLLRNSWKPVSRLGMEIDFLFAFVFINAFIDSWSFFCVKNVGLHRFSVSTLQLF